MSYIRSFIAVFACFLLILFLAGCSAGKQGLLSITPQQYFYSAKEKLETIDERDYEVRDLDEIIRVMENAEKDAKSSEIMDKSRLYLTLLNTLKAEKQFKENRLKGQYLANRAEPFFALDIKQVKETLRLGKKWLRICEAQYKTKTLLPDLYFVRGMFYTQKMLTQTGIERHDSFWTAVHSFRRCLSMAPDFKADFRLFGKIQTPREVRLKLIECLALGGELTDAYAMISEYIFSPATPKLDYPWMHMQGFVLAFMGHHQEAVEILEKFKIIRPQDYPRVDDALWLLEGVYDRLKEVTRDDTYGVEAKITASLLKQLKGPFSQEKYTTASHLFPRWASGDIAYFEGVKQFMNGDFKKARALLDPIKKAGLLTLSHRHAVRIIALENDLYAGEKIADETIEDLLSLALEKSLSPLLKERLGFLLARYVLGEMAVFKQGKLEGESQTFVKSMISKPWTIKTTFEKDPPKPAENRPRPRRTKKGEAFVPSASPSLTSDQAPSAVQEATLRAEIYAQKPDDWIVSANLSLVLLPELSLVGKGKVVGREEEGKGWVFRSPEITEITRGKRFLAVFEYSNSDSEKSFQGILLDYSPPQLPPKESPQGIGTP